MARRLPIAIGRGGAAVGIATFRYQRSLSVDEVSMKALVLSTTVLLLTACSNSAPYVLTSDPSDPHAPYRPTRYVSVTAGTASYRPAEPKPWAENGPAAQGESQP